MTSSTGTRFVPYLSRALSSLPGPALLTLGGARCVDPEMAAFAELTSPLDPLQWRDLGSIAGPTAVLQLGPDIEPQAPWSVAERFRATIMTLASPGFAAASDPRVRVLGEQDLEEIRTLSLRSEMGAFPTRALEFGHHVGVRVDGRLVAMAGRRFIIDDRVEISWVSTDPDYRRRGLGADVVVEKCRRILAEGRTPYLVVVDGNPASALYERLGFVPTETISGIAVTREENTVG